MKFQRGIRILLGSGLGAIQVTLVHERGRGGAVRSVFVVTVA